MSKTSFNANKENDIFLLGSTGDKSSHLFESTSNDMVKSSNIPNLQNTIISKDSLILSVVMEGIVSDLDRDTSLTNSTVIIRNEDVTRIVDSSAGSSSIS